MLAPRASASARCSSSEWREEFMDPMDDGVEGMTFGTNAIDRWLVANQTGAPGKTERIPVDLLPVRRIDIEVDQT